MVEGRLLPAHALVGQSDQEGNQVVLLLARQSDRLDVRIQVVGILAGEVATAAVEVDDLAQRGLAAVVEVRPGQFDVAQAGYLEVAVDGGAVGGRQWRGRQVFVRSADDVQDGRVARATRLEQLLAVRRLRQGIAERVSAG